jgi:hypothetical protein
LRVDDDALNGPAVEFSGPGEEIRSEDGEKLTEFADAGRWELSAVLVLQQFEGHRTDPVVDPCETGEQFAVTLDHWCSPIGSPCASWCASRQQEQS